MAEGEGRSTSRALAEEVRPGDAAARRGDVPEGRAAPAEQVAAERTARSARRKLRDVWAIDARPRWLAFAATPSGRVALFACFGVLLSLAMPLRLVPIVLLGAAGAAFWNERRDQAVLLATVAALALEPVWYSDPSFEAHLASLATGVISARNVQRVLTALLFLACALALRHVARRPAGLFARHPVLTLLGLLAFTTALGLVLQAFGVESLWLLIALKLLASYMWFLAYAVADQRSKQRSSLTHSLGLLHPFWGSSSTPIGKGAGYLAKLRPKDSAELARVQLKGLKLLIWSLVLQGLSLGLAAAALAAGIPPLERVVHSYAQGAPTHLLVGWAAMILAVAIGALELAVWGHRIVACARLAGFQLRRNTFRPLESRSLAEFWNRYYFYFKELLLDFFFYPTFFRVFKRRPKLRTFCATFMAAGVGNAIYHFVRDIDLLFSLGPARALTGYGSYVVYCVLLASGIAISQVRTNGIAPRNSSLGSRIGSFVCVWGFVVCIHVFGGIEDRTLPFLTRVSFTLHQFGVGT